MRKCVFCGAGSLTREHVLPDWLTALYPTDELVTNEIIGGPGNKWKSKIFQHKVRVVCSNCNNSWMSGLEMKAKPIITMLISLRSFTIDKHSQELLAFWSQKTLCMLNQSTSGGLKITQDLYDDIYNRKTFSQKVMVSIGWRMNNKGNKEEPIVSYQIMQAPSVEVPKELLGPVGLAKESGGFIWKAMFALGPLIFDLVGHNMPIKLQIGLNTKVLKVIQPYEENISWPLEWPIEAEGGLEAIRFRL